MFFAQAATVETWQGTGASGDVFAAPVTVSGFLDDGVQRVEGPGGVQLVQQSKWYCRLSDAALFTPGTRITANGRVCYVIEARRRDASAFDGPSHTECDLR